MVLASDGQFVHYREGGTASGAYPIVLVPGWTMPGWIWSEQMRLLGRRTRVFAMDPRAQGRSPSVPGMDLSPDRRARDIGDLISLKHLDHVLVVGWSLGAVEAVRYARAAPRGAVSGVVLVDQPLYDAPSREAARKRFRDQLRTHRRAAMESFVRGMFVRPPAGDLVHRLLVDAMKTPLDMSLALLGGESGDLAPWCRSAGVPVLVILTTRFSDQGKRFKGDDPAARVEVVPDCGHAVFIDEPGRFAGLVEDFARSVAR